jgi:hypothetical protein
VAQFVETLSYKPEGGWFDSRGVIKILIDLILPAAPWPWSLLSLKQKKMPPGSKDGRSVGLTTLPPCLEFFWKFWKSQTSGALKISTFRMNELYLMLE